jgi:hypothetical protein
MLSRASNLCQVITSWLERYGDADVKLPGVLSSLDDWSHVRYLIIFLRLFFHWTEGISAASTPNIGKSWAIYTSLFKQVMACSCRGN